MTDKLTISSVVFHGPSATVTLSNGAELDGIRSVSVDAEAGGWTTVNLSCHVTDDGEARSATESATEAR